MTCKWPISRLATISCKVVLLSIFCSCSNNPLSIDVSHIQVEKVSIQRFDRDFFALNADNIVQKLPELQKKYPAFTELFVKNFLCSNGIKDNACIPEITKFINDKEMKTAFTEAQKVFQNLNDVEMHLTNAFKHHKYYFPDKKLPRGIAMMSGFNYSIASADTMIAIGLEMYLGKKCPFYEMMQIPNYKRTTMQKEYIACDFVHKWMLDEFPNNMQSRNLLADMIYQGKLLYLADALMPELSDTIKIGFTEKQSEWCIEHENDMWGFIIKNKFLYSSEVEVISKFTGEGPFTTGFVKESPARTGVWIGWRIVKGYMNENPKISLDQLMQEADPQKILSFSKYKP